jgi:YHS domain-containing protein
MEDVMAMVVDPVCRREFDESEAAASSVFLGKTYYFCSEEDRQLFQEHPEKYVEPAVSRQTWG